MRRALARRAVLIISISSIRLSLMFGGHVDWTMNRSLPRMSSLMSITTSPSAKRPIYASPTSPATHAARSQLAAQILHDLLGQRTVGVSRKDAQVALQRV